MVDTVPSSIFIGDCSRRWLFLDRYVSAMPPRQSERGLYEDLDAQIRAAPLMAHSCPNPRGIEQSSHQIWDGA